MHCEDKVSSLMNPTMMYTVKNLSIKYQERIRGNATVTKWIKIVLTVSKKTFSFSICSYLLIPNQAPSLMHVSLPSEGNRMAGKALPLFIIFLGLID